ncbi:MAG: cytochrome C biogenesis protein [Gammaproteobacteria bacterium]|nr:cytochrome C biogenesis protein [Gammaproteobacteria bacterium]
MSGIWPGALILLALAAVFVLFPRWFMRSQQQRSLRADNLEWYAQRQRELASEPGSQQLLEDAQLRLLEDGVDSLGEEHTELRVWQGWLLLLPLVALTLLLYVQLGAAPDVQLARDLQGLAENSSEADFLRLRKQLEVRAGQRPDNLHYQAMLGSFNMNEGNYGAAREIYQGLIKRAPGDASARALAAQAGFLAAGRQLDRDNQLLAEQALSIDPHQRTALGLLGMAAYENGQYRAAIGYWRRLLVQESPDASSGQMIASVIQMAEQALGEAGGAAEVAIAAPTSAGVSVTIQLPPGAKAAPDDSVFVFARDPDSGSRMPVAVQRFPASRLPLTLRLDDATSMAGQKISQLAQVVVIARVSPGGQPGEEHASWQAQIGPLAPSLVEDPRMLILQRKKI